MSFLSLFLSFLSFFVFVFLLFSIYFIDIFFKVVEFETMRKGANRAAYTRRISEIVGNIKKQKEEINKVFRHEFVAGISRLRFRHLYLRLGEGKAMHS